MKQRHPIIGSNTFVEKSKPSNGSDSKVLKMNKASAVNIRMKKYSATKNVNLLKEALKSKNTAKSNSSSNTKNTLININISNQSIHFHQNNFKGPANFQDWDSPESSTILNTLQTLL